MRAGVVMSCRNASCGDGVRTRSRRAPFGDSPGVRVASRPRRDGGRPPLLAASDAFVPVPVPEPVPAASVASAAASASSRSGIVPSSLSLERCGARSARRRPRRSTRGARLPLISATRSPRISRSPSRSRSASRRFSAERKSPSTSARVSLEALEAPREATPLGSAPLGSAAPAPAPAPAPSPLQLRGRRRRRSLPAS